MLKQLLIVVQTVLKSLGYYHGILDGMPGEMTSFAVIEFKKRHGLRARDLIGVKTMHMLMSKEAKRALKPKIMEGVPPWLAEAYRLMGTKEVSGKGDNPIIMDWARNLDQWYPGDDVPWCGLFIAHCMSVGAPEEPQDFNRLGARAWRAFGVESKPCIGSVAVFWRTHKTKSVNGHVALLIGEDETSYHIVGGNQSDAVTATRISKERKLEFRVPEGFVGDTNLKSVIKNGQLSTNEA